MELRTYQKEIAEKALFKLKEKGIVYLALETRVGKTLTALHIAELFGAKNVLFVTKLKAVGSIVSDYQKYIPPYNLTVINYESVSKHKDEYDLAICDEAHSISTFPRPSKRFKDLQEIVYNIPVILMSATPSPESYSQLYHQFTINKFHSWNKAGNFYKWAKVYVTPQVKYYFGKEINDYSNANKEYIDRATKDYFITFTQKKAGFTQEVEEKILYCTMQKETYDMIDRLNKDLIIEVNSKVILGDTAAKLMMKTHQLSSGTVICENGEGMIIDRSKATFIRDCFKGKKIAIYYKFKQEFELLKQTFENWTASPEEFQNGEFTFLGQFQSAREGIRLDKADALIFFNIDFSYLSYEQSKNRIISKERESYTPLYFVFSNSGIEKRIYNVVKNKSDYTYSHYKKDYGKGYTTQDYSGSYPQGVVLPKSDTVQQTRLAGFDVIERPKHYLH